MSLRRDTGLAGGVLVATGVAVFAVGADVSLPWVVAGALGTLGFELVATRRRATVRGYWDRPRVQATSVAAALVVVALGAWLAPSPVLSAVVGALVAYLLVLAVVAAG